MIKFDITEDCVGKDGVIFLSVDWSHHWLQALDRQQVKYKIDVELSPNFDC